MYVSMALAFVFHLAMLLTRGTHLTSCCLPACTGSKLSRCGLQLLFALHHRRHHHRYAYRLLVMLRNVFSGVLNPSSVPPCICVLVVCQLSAARVCDSTGIYFVFIETYRHHEVRRFVYALSFHPRDRAGHAEPITESM